MKSLIILLLLIVIGCSKISYPVRGTILEVRKESNEFLINHDDIPGFMMAMTMPFTLSDSLDIDRYSIGDSVKFRLVIENQTAVATQFHLEGKINLPESADGWKDDEYTPLEIGEIFDDVSFLDLDSNIMSLSSNDGKFRFISYIFTRCPMPNMCPAVVTKNQYLAQVFSENSDIEFILVSFDYVYDTPTIIKSTYGSLLEANPKLKAYSSFGHLNDIFTLAGQSNVSFWGIDENDIGHTLRSVLLDPDRRLLKVFDGTDWRPEAAERDIRNILKAYSY